MSAVAAAWTLAFASAAIQAPRAHPAADAMRYGELVQRYLRDDGGEAVREVASWSADMLSDAVDGVEDSASPGLEGIPQMRAVRAFLPAAVMLHTEAALLLNGQDESEAAALHWDCARQLAALPSWTREQEVFLRAWYRAAGLFSLGSYDTDDAILLLDRGVQFFPDDLLLAVALGQAYEARGTFRNGRVLSKKTNLGRDARKDLVAAEGLFREVLKKDPLQWEARLRLGRCLWLGGRGEAALAELERTRSNGDPAALRYLASLFTADLLRRESRVSEARQEFARAVEIWPDGQTAALGLAETLHTLGERAAAGAVLQAAIVERAGTARVDPYHGYHFGDRSEHKRLLEAARDLARAPSAR